MKNRIFGPPLLSLALMVGAFLIPTDVEAQTPYDTSVVDVLEAHGEFGTFLQAIEAVGFEQALRSDGPFTVFAPTDAAFATLPDGQLEALMQDPEALAGLLGYHLVPGEYDAEALAQTPTVASAFGEVLQVSAEGGTIQVNAATVTDAGHAADNGLVHVVDEVLMTP